jgi:drug/metabolite transporter (DMT)-like permease
MSAVELALVMVSALLHAWWSVSIKGSRDPMVFNLLQVLAVVPMLLVVLPLLPWGEIPASVWRLLAVTGVAHACYFYWLSRAFERGDLTLVYPIARSTPALLPLVAVPLLGESLTAGGALGIAVVVGGVWLVHLGPELTRSAFAGPAARFAYLTLGATVVYSLADKAAMSELAGSRWPSPVPRAAAYFVLLSAASALGFVPLALRHSGLRRVRETAPTELLPATLASLVSLLGYGLILRALETAPASYVVAVRQSSVLFAILLGVALLRERPGRPRILGGVATVVGVTLIALLGS